MIKKLFILFICLYTSEVAIAQKKLPSFLLSDLEGKTLNLADYSMDYPVIVSFWATWCEPCLRELNKFSQERNLIENDLKAKLITISIDDARTVSRIVPMMSGNDWEFPVYLDENQVVKRSLNIIDIPHTLIVYKKKIIYEHVGYINGDEEFLFQKIRDINSK